MKSIPFLLISIPQLNDIDHPVLIEEWKQNLDADAYENF